MQFVPSKNRVQPAGSPAVADGCALRLSGLCKSFRDVAAVDNVDLDLAHGEILCLLGPSGCGKTTTLRLIAGFDQPDAGTVRIRDRMVCGSGVNVAPEKRRVGMVFQEGALFPHLTVAQNLAFGLKKGRQRKQQVAEALHLVNLADCAARYPHQLSGGQQQRVALARALAPAPDLMLMDEPFSSLDPGLRGQLRAEVRAILKERGATVVCVTHDQDEAMQLADRVAVMNQGRIEQLGSPEQVFSHPNTRFAAEFFGTADFLPAWQDGAYLASEVGRVPWSASWATPPSQNGELLVMLRPDCLDLESDPESNGAASNGAVVRREFLGGFNLYSVELDSGHRVQVIQSHLTRFDAGMRVRTFLRAGHQLLPFRNGRAL